MTDVKWTKTHCGRMDHGGCGLLVGVSDNKIISIKGDPEGYLNQGYTCFKGRVSGERLYHPDRLKYPLKRAGKRGQGKWTRISWEEALDETAAGLLDIKEKYGAQAVGFGVGMPKGLEHFILIRLANVFGSPNVVASQDVCHAPREVTGMHTCGFYPVADLHHPTQLILSWASNILSTNEEGQIGSLLLNQIKRGTKLMVIDPRHTELARKADLWLRPTPGTDHALALGFINVIIEEELYDKEFVNSYTVGFDELDTQTREYNPQRVAAITGIPADQIQQAARLYAVARPAALQWGNALEHDMNVFDATRALVCLMAITGNLEVPGGNINAHDPEVMGMGRFVRADLIPDKNRRMIGAHYGTIPRMMTVPPAYFRRAILEDQPYPVRGYYCMCANPLVAWADSNLTYRAFQKLDFMAVAEIFMTPTASMADIVLPVAHQYEINDIGHYGLGHGMVLCRSKVVEPPEECWPDIKIMNELGKRISNPEYWHEDFEQFLEDLLGPSGLSYEQFASVGFLKGPDRFKQYQEKGFRTPSGKVELKLSSAEKLGTKPLPEYTGLPEAVDADYPLQLISAKSRYYLLSSYRWVEKLRQKRPHPTVEIHPETAALYGINDGDQVKIETRYGQIIQQALLTEIVPLGVISAALGWWYPEGDVSQQYEWRRSNFNMLSSTGKLGREFGTPNIKNLVCRISRA